MADPLWLRLEKMSDDIQIGGDVNFRAMGIAVKRAGNNLTKAQAKEMRRLLDLADTLIVELLEFWDEFPELKKYADPKEICASDLRPSNVE